MKHSLQLKLSQHLTLTPQLQQSIRLLQLSTLELNQEIDTFLQENPLLERDDEEEAPSPPPTLTPATTSATSSESESSPAAGDNERADERPAGETDWSIDDGYGSFSGQDGDEDAEAPQASADRRSCAITCSTRSISCRCPTGTSASSRS